MCFEEFTKGRFCYVIACGSKPAGYKNHIGFYPTGQGVEMFKDELSAYKFSKGAVQFPLDKPIPYDLITKITKYRVEQNLK